MKKIGGNVTAQLQRKTSTKSDLGEVINAYEKIADIIGWLDLSSGSSELSKYNAKITESSHMFICDYVELPTIRPEELRLIINNKIYEIKYIDVPMGLNYHYEFYLKYIDIQ